MKFSTLAFLLVVLAAGGCGFRRDRDAENRRIENDKNSAAFKAGQTAHKITKQAEKAAASAGRKIGEAARKAREGWKEEQRQKDR